MTRDSARPGGTLVLDTEGLAKAVSRDVQVRKYVGWAVKQNVPMVTSAAILVEAMHPQIRRAAFEWTLAHIVVEPVTEAIARRAARLLDDAGLHGHKHAIDAMLAATALVAPTPVTILTSGPDDVRRLCGEAASVIRI